MFKVKKYLIVSRHEDTIKLLMSFIEKQFDTYAEVLEHLTEDKLRELDENSHVFGNLPLNMIAQVINKGASFYSLELDIPKELRGRELDEQTLAQLKTPPKLNKYKVELKQSLLLNGEKVASMKSRLQSARKYLRKAWDGRLSKFIQVSFCTLGVALGAGIFVDGICGAKMFDNWPFLAGSTSSVYSVIGLGIFLFYAVCLKFASEKFFPLRSVDDIKNLKPHKALVIGLSDWTFQVIGENEQGYQLARQNTETNALEWTLDLPADLDKLDNDFWRQVAVDGIRINWEMVIRMLKHHQKAIQYIVLIATKDTKANIQQATKLINMHLPTCQVAVDEQVIDNPFDVEQWYEAYESAVHGLLKAHKELTEDDIIIDCTQGTKTTSIAAALVTMHNKLKFQYVETSKEKLVRGYGLISVAQDN